MSSPVGSADDRTGPDELVETGQAPREPFPIQALAAAYDLGRWRSVHWLSAGKNDHAHVVTDSTTFFLRRSYRSKPLASLRWQVDLLRVLRRHALPVPVPLAARHGDPFVALGGRLFLATATLPGAPYDPAQPEHVRAAGHTLAAYHRIAGGLPNQDPDPRRQTVLDALRDRLALADPDGVPELYARARHLLDRLHEVWACLPWTVIHGGCRRGSLLFTGSQVTGVLDFDSAREAPRALDLAIALHDIGKVYTAPDRADHKVGLELGRIEAFVRAYRETGTLTPDEAHALPLLVAAKRAQRALGRAARMIPGAEPGAGLSPGDLAKIRMETARLRWLADHEVEFRSACGGSAVTPSP